MEPGYIGLLKEQQLKQRVSEAQKHLTECKLCPHRCGINRQHKLGFCGAADKVVVNSYGPHFGEEYPLVGHKGSGTIFFAYCNMRCVFCQNWELSFGGEGQIITNEALAEIMLLLQNHYHCHNINLVTPTHFVPNILAAVLMAAQKGLNLPLVYNCGGYESLETLSLLDGIVDIYLPDFKYISAERASLYSGVRDYPEKAKLALKEMNRQVGGLKVNKDGIAYRGLIIRHLMLPGGLEDTKEVLKFIKEELSPDCALNLMDQYYPAHQAFRYPELSHNLVNQEYLEALAFAQGLGLNII
jgi:putative pyruvate formate lyase activating enzyme